MGSAGVLMIGKRIALEIVPNQALFSLKAAAQYLGVSPKTLREIVAQGLIPCYEFAHQRTFKLEDLETLRAGLKPWNNHGRPIPASAAS